MPLNLECQNKTKAMRSCFLLGCKWEGRGGFLCQGLLQIWQLNSVESSSGKVIGSMRPIVREVGADSSNSNELGFWNGF